MENKQWTAADVAKLLERFDLTQTELATITGINQSRISDWVTGKREPTGISNWGLLGIEQYLIHKTESEKDERKV